MLCHSALIMTRSPFSNAVTFEKHNPTLFSYHRWKRIQRNNRANTAHLQNITSSLPKKWQWPKNRRPTVAICPSDCDDGKSIFGHHISPWYTGRQFSAIIEDNGGSKMTQCFFFIFFFIFFKTKNKKREEEKGKKRLECFTSYWAPSPQWPLVGGKLSLEIRGHFLCLFTCAQHTVISLNHTHTQAQADLAVPSEHLRQRGLRQFGLHCDNKSETCVWKYVLASPTAVTQMTWWPWD